MSRIAIRYAKALFETAREKNELEKVEQDFQLIKDTIDSNNDVRSLIFNPLIPTRSKSEISSRIFGNRISKNSMNFLKLVFAKRRSENLPDIISRFEEMVRDYKGIVVAEIISSHALEDSQKQEIKRKIGKITGKEIQLTEKTDQTLLGGFVVRIKDTVLDFSVRHQLDHLRDKMIYS